MWIAQFIAWIAALGAAIGLTGWVALQVGEYRRQRAESREVDYLRWRVEDLESLADRMIAERDAHPAQHIAGARR